MRPSSALPLLLSLLILPGCAKKPINIVGNWKMNAPMPMGGGGSTAIVFSADKTMKGVFDGTWSLSGDIVTITPTTMAGMPISQLKSMMANMPNGQAGAAFFDKMTLKVDGDSKAMSLTDGKGTVSKVPMFTKTD